MQVLLFVIQLIQIPAIILGLISMVGLILQRKTFSEVLVGTVKTILGLLILGIGTTALINAIVPIQNMFQAGFSATGLHTFVTFDVLSLGLTVQTFWNYNIQDSHQQTRPLLNLQF